MLEQFITSSILILAICLIRAAFAKRMSPTILYALWLLAAVKLLIPMTGLENRYNVMNLISGQEQTEETADSTLVTETKDIAPAAPQTAASDNSNPEALTADKTSEETAAKTAEAAKAESSAVTVNDSGAALRQILPRLAVWVARIGSVMLAVIFLISNLVFYIRLRKTRVSQGEYRGLTVYEIPGKGSPFLYGLGRPAIYLSKDLELLQENKDYILLHEYTHSRHRDYIWALVRSVCVILYWYHPLVWLAAVLSARDGELACDEGVTKALNEERRIEYGETLLETLKQIRNDGMVKSPLSLTTGMTGGAKEMKKRMERIARHPHVEMAAVAALVVLGIGLIGCTYGGAAQEDSAGEDDTSVGLLESAYLRENPGEVREYAVVGEDEVTLTLDFDNDGVAEQVSMTKGSTLGHDPDGGWDVYSLECDSNTIGSKGTGVVGNLYAISQDGENILIGVVNEAWWGTYTDFYSYTSQDGEKKLRYLNNVSEDIRSGQSITSGATVENGILYLWEPLEMQGIFLWLYEDYIRMGYTTGEDGTLNQIAQDSYELMGYPYLYNSYSQGPTLLADVALYDNPDGEFIGTAQAGQEIQLRRIAYTYNQEKSENSYTWYCLYADGQELGWIEAHCDEEKNEVVWGGTGLGEAEVFTDYTPL